MLVELEVWKLELFKVLAELEVWTPELFKELVELEVWSLQGARRARDMKTSRNSLKSLTY